MTLIAAINILALFLIVDLDVKPQPKQTKKNPPF